MSIVLDQMKNILDLDLKNHRASNILYDGSVTVEGQSSPKSIFELVSLYEALFYGDTFDDIQSSEEVLENILMYFNLHIRQEGLDYYIYHRASIGNDITWTALSGVNPSTPQQDSGFPYYMRIEDSYVMVGDTAHEKLRNVRDYSDILPGKTLAKVLGNSIEKVGNEYRRYYNWVLPNGTTVKSDKYETVDVSDDLTYIRKNGTEKILIQSPNGDYEFLSLEPAPQSAYSGGTFTKSYYQASQNEFIVSKE